MLKRFAMVEHSSLFDLLISDEEKKSYSIDNSVPCCETFFIVSDEEKCSTTLTPGANFIKPFCGIIYATIGLLPPVLT
jgi:hypothetical protein